MEHRQIDHLVDAYMQRHAPAPHVTANPTWIDDVDGYRRLVTALDRRGNQCGAWIVVSHEELENLGADELHRLVIERAKNAVAVVGNGIAADDALDDAKYHALLQTMK